MAGPNKFFLSIDASVVISTEYSKLRKEGGEHILLSNKGRNLYASVCLFAFLLCQGPFIQSISHMAGVFLWTQGSAVLHFAAIWTRDTFRINKLLINRTARAGSGVPQACRVYMLRERTLH